MFHPTFYECERSIELARLGYLFANGQLSADEASHMIVLCQPIAGYFALETLDVEGLMSWAADRWVNAEDIRSLVEAACRHVWNKWDSHGDIADAAQEWAMDLVEEWARDEGIRLFETEEDRDPVETV